MVDRKHQLHLDQELAAVAKVAKRLPAILGRSAVPRGKLEELFHAGDDGAAQRLVDEKRVTASIPQEELRLAQQALEKARCLAESTPLEKLYSPRLDEFDLELQILADLGTEQARLLAARRFPTGKEKLQNGQTLKALAELVLERFEANLVEDDSEPLVASGASNSLEAALRAVATAARIPVEIRVIPNLVAKAAAGEKTVFISGRETTRNEALRLAAHEVLAHLVAATNARSQRLMILRVGTAESFSDQEGLALMLEAKSQTLSAARLRVIAGRTLAAHATYAGATFVELVRLLEQKGFSLADSVVLAERAQRGGGVAKDAAYLLGLVRVRRALLEGEHIDTLRAGRLSVSSLPLLQELRALDASLFRPPNYRPSLSRSLAATGFGTSPATSPPSRAASLTILDDT